jgi:hypothetical protein
MRMNLAALAALSVFAGMTSANASITSVKNQLVTLEDQQSESTYIGMVSPEEVARQFLKANAAKLGLNSELTDLVTEATVRTPVGYHVRFQQVQNKMAVYAANVVVTLNRRLQVVTYVNSYQPILNTEQISVPKIKSTEAVRGVYGYLKLNSSPRHQQVIPMILVKDGQPKVIYRVRINAPVDKKYAWEILTDASSNEVLYAKDITMNHESETTPASAGNDRLPAIPLADKVTALVFDPNPTVRSGKSYGQAPGYNDINNGDNDFYNGNLVQVELPDVSKSNGVFQLNGKYVQITDHESPTNPDCKSTNANMNYSRSKPCFDAVTVYYFIDKSLRYLNETLGVQAMPFQYQGGVKADPKGLNGDDNSHYDPSTGELAFGEGGIDDAQDHDVVLHELGHGIHDWVTHGHLSQNQGLSEGSGDYWALSYARQFMKPGHLAYSWIFGFDGHNEFWPGRVANVSGTYPSAAGGEIHTAGQLWATTCMLVWDKLGKAKTDRIFWSALAMLNDSSSQADAANAFVKATQELSPADRATVVSVFRSKGFPVQ